MRGPSQFEPSPLRVTAIYVFATQEQYLIAQDPLCSFQAVILRRVLHRLFRGSPFVISAVCYLPTFLRSPEATAITLHRLISGTPILTRPRRQTNITVAAVQLGDALDASTSRRGSSLEPAALQGTYARQRVVHPGIRHRHGDKWCSAQ
jgi:hypothetical protein